VSNARIIIPAAIALSILMPLIFGPATPGWLQALGAVAFVVLVAGLVAFLFLRASAWPSLAQRYPPRVPVTRSWRACRTAVIGRAGFDDPAYEQSKVRLVGILRVAPTDDALNLSVLPLLRLLLPPLQIPWSAIVRARLLDASGWVRAPRDPGALFQVTYDPGYTGRFIELQTTEPRVFIQLPAPLLAEVTAHLPVEPSSS
jgi:hypothetical protein